MSITKKYYGNTNDGKSADIFTLTNNNGMTAEITNLGGIIVSLKVPDKSGNLADVVLGYDSIEGYLKKGPYFGAAIGRYANRIAAGHFKLNGKDYHLAKNEGENHLHGGSKGFDKVLWVADLVNIHGVEGLQLSYTSEDGEEGYPGNLDVKITYILTEDNALEINYLAATDKDTVVNLTNHSYFNLSGHNSGNILNHKVMVNSEKFTVVDRASIPTGELRDTTGTPFDFKVLTAIGDRIENEYEQLKFTGGYDHNFVIKDGGEQIVKAAEVYDPNSGRTMEVFTDKPGIQLYTGNFLDGTEIGKGGTPYSKRNGLCLETQFYPDSPNVATFPSPILAPGQEYNYTTIYKFK